MKHRNAKVFDRFERKMAHHFAPPGQPGHAAQKKPANHTTAVFERVFKGV